MQMNQRLQHRCGDWAPRIVEKMIGHVKENEPSDDEEHLVNLIDLTYNEESMDGVSRHYMVQIATEIKEKHVQQDQKAKDERVTANAPVEFKLPKGVYPSLFNPNRANKNNGTSCQRYGGSKIRPGQKQNQYARTGNSKQPPPRPVLRLLSLCYLSPSYFI